jgi:hypothetical protein
VRIPLDYYRILGLPIQATAEQLQQAHRDRTLQLPRREYSERAIESRKSLIDEAYALLSNPEKRQTYDAQFLTRAYTPDVLEPPPSESTAAPADPDPQLGEETLRLLASDQPPAPTPEPYTPTIEVDDPQFVGALLILLELGEYELVIRLGRPFVTNGTGSLANGRYGEPNRIRGDIVLTLALACLELGREQWQQNQYEQAAESLETGQELLMSENLFPAIRHELQADLFKLRPYRILELVARPLEQSRDRRQGLQLLKAMLQDRGGIDGVGDDSSGLSTDDFLRFVQQLRGYLTAGEQQEIFEAEARRPSAVATYLAVYALLARGFSFHQPALVRRAKQLLQRVGTHQDVHLEQAVCALLLGQAEAAGRALERSQEYEPLAFIREHSQGAPDLLPGLCLYAERWLREEVFSHFRDLAEQQSSLKDYFADPQVQAFLEQIPMAAPVTEPTGASPEGAPSPWSSSPSPSFDRAPMTPPPMQTPAVPFYADSSLSLDSQSRLEERAAKTDILDDSAAGAELSVAERVSQLSPDGQLQTADNAPPKLQSDRNGHSPSAAVTNSPSPSRPPSSRSPKWGRLAGVGLVGFVAVGILGVVTVRTVSWLGALLSGPRIQQPALDLGLLEPPVSIPQPPPPEAQITTSDIAERTITNWLEAKRDALGPEHQVEQLETILMDPALTNWQNRAQGGDLDNWHYIYEHSIDVLTVEPDDPTTNTLTVEAEIKEVADFYELGARVAAESYDATLTMRYELIRQEGDWFVSDMGQVE